MDPSLLAGMEWLESVTASAIDSDPATLFATAGSLPHYFVEFASDVFTALNSDAQGRDILSRMHRLQTAVKAAEHVTEIAAGLGHRTAKKAKLYGSSAREPGVCGTEKEYLALRLVGEPGLKRLCWAMHGEVEIFVTEALHHDEVLRSIGCQILLTAKDDVEVDLESRAGFDSTHLELYDDLQIELDEAYASLDNLRSDLRLEGANRTLCLTDASAFTASCSLSENVSQRKRKTGS